MGYYHPAGGKGTQAELAKKYGVAGTDYSDRPGMGDGNVRDSRDVERDIRKAMLDDYDTREFLKYNEDIRDEANEIRNLRDQNAFIHDAMTKAHKDAGNGGKFDNANDFAGVAQNAFETYEADQRAQTEKYTNKKFNKLKNKMDDEGTSSESAAKNMSYNEYLANSDTQKATEGFSSAAKGQNDGSADKAAQDLLSSSVKSIASDKDLVAKGQVGQGKYVLNELGKSEFQS